jgi:hypothetical protein
MVGMHVEFEEAEIGAMVGVSAKAVACVWKQDATGADSRLVTAAKGQAVTL